MRFTALDSKLAHLVIIQPGVPLNISTRINAGLLHALVPIANVWCDMFREVEKKKELV
jgi:hypothetical protein